MKNAAVFFLIGMLAACAAANAGQAILQWTNPTRNTDDTLIPSTGSLALASTIVEYTSCASVAAVQWPASPPSVSIVQPATSATLSNLNEGETYCFRVRVVNQAGTASDNSNVASKTISVTVPMPPSNVTVQ